MFGNVVISLIASAASPPFSCEPYVGQIVAPQAFDAAVARFLSVRQKGEYETTAAFELRRNAAIGPIKMLTVQADVKSRSSFVYDADAGVLRVQGFAFEGSGGYNPAHLIGTEAAKLGDGQNINVQVSRIATTTGSYRASNAFGASANVIRQTEVSKVIFDGNNSRSSDARHLFVAGHRTENVGAIPLSPDEAQRLKPKLRIAFLVEPQEPFAVETLSQKGVPTIADPRRVTEKATVLLGNIRCGIVTDDHNMVFGAFPTN